MSDLEYTITKFDTGTKVLDVDFNDGSWARIQLSTPLPKNQTELENIIRDFAPSVEVIQAQTEPDADISFIETLVGNKYSTARKKLTTTEEQQVVDEETEANALHWEQVQFKKQIADVLIELGVIQSNPIDLPVSEV